MRLIATWTSFVQRPMRDRALSALMTASLLVGCANTVSSADLTDFGTAAATLSRQTDAKIAEVNRIARDAAVDRFARSAAVGLTGAPFAPAVPDDFAVEWRAAFDNL